MIVFPKAILAAVVVASTLTACSTNEYGERRLNSTGRGAAIGAAGGAVVGAVAGDDNRWEDRDGRRYYYDRRDRDRRYYYNDRRERMYDPR